MSEDLSERYETVTDYDTYGREWREEQLERLGIPQDPLERTHEEGNEVRKMSAPTAGWLFQLSRTEHSGTTMHTQNGVYRVTVEKMEETNE